MSADLNHIGKVCSNSGGIVFIMAFNMDNVVPAISGIQTGDPDFTDPDKVWSIQFRRNKAGYVERPKNGKGGVSWTQTLSAEVARARLSVEQFIRTVGNRRIGLVYVDRNGFIRYLYDMRLQASYATGSSRTDANVYTLQFSKESRKKTDYIAGEIDVDVVIGGPPITGGPGPSTKQYLRMQNFSGDTLVLPFSLPVLDADVKKDLFVFRDGSKLALNHEWGFTRVDSTLTFDDPLDGETLEILYIP